MWEALTGAFVRRLTGHKDAISETDGLAFSPFGKRLASASFDKTARIWNVETGENLVILKGHTGFVTGVYFTPDGQHIVTSGQDKSIVIWENKSASPLRTLAGHKNIVFGLGFVARDSTSKTPFTLDEEAPLLVSASYDRTLRVWDTDSGVTVRVLEGYSGGVNGIAVHAPQDPNRKEGKSSVRPSMGQ